MEKEKGGKISRGANEALPREQKRFIDQRFE